MLEIVGPDLDALLGFYLSIGFVLERRTGDFAVVHWHGQRLFLAGNPDAPVRDCWSNLRIMVADADALWREAEVAGSRLVSAEARLRRAELVG